MKVNTPIAATLLAVPPASLELMDGFPGIDYADNQVTFVADDLRAAYDGLVAIVGVARQSYSGVLSEVINAHPETDNVFASYRLALFDRWLDVESGRWTAPEPGLPNTEGRQYHGYR